MKKIGIITLCSNDNYGNKLQNYALKKKLEDLGCTVETLWVDNAFRGNNIKLILKKIRKDFIDLSNYSRTKFFTKFNKEYLNLGNKHLIFNNDLEKVKNKYDYFCVGSDQVWNYKLFDNFDTYFMLKIEKNKCFSYAASIAANNIPENLIEKYKEGFNHMMHISLRETKGKELAERISKRNDIEELIDPTMLLTDSEWNKIVKKPKKLKKDKFILNYFLGELSEERKKEIDKIAKENNCEVINILDKKCDLYNSGPMEFLYLEKNAFLICTDSFHSSVFAILFNRPFIVFDREGNGLEMNSRIYTLLDKFKLQNRMYDGKIERNNLQVDYLESYDILEEERKKSSNFIKKAIDFDEWNYENEK